MKDYIRERILQEAKYIVKNNATADRTSKKFYTTKATVYKDMIKLKQIDEDLYKKVKEIMSNNQGKAKPIRTLITCECTTCKYNTASLKEKEGFCTRPRVKVVLVNGDYADCKDYHFEVKKDGGKYET